MSSQIPRQIFRLCLLARIASWINVHRYPCYVDSLDYNAARPDTAFKHSNFSRNCWNYSGNKDNDSITFFHSTNRNMQQASRTIHALSTWGLWMCNFAYLCLSRFVSAVLPGPWSRVSLTVSSCPWSWGSSFGGSAFTSYSWHGSVFTTVVCIGSECNIIRLEHGSK